MTPPVVKKSGFPRHLNDEIWGITLNLIVTFKGYNYLQIRKLRKNLTPFLLRVDLIGVWAKLTSLKIY